MADRLDLSLVEKDLSREAREPVGPMPWLRRSYDAPDDFWTALLDANGAFFAWQSKSRLHRQYDFYHDIFARNRQNPAPAFRWFQETGGWQELGYGRLERLAAEKAALWESLGAGAGRILCLVSHVDERFLVAFLAALKIGMVVSLLPPWGFSFLRRRIDAAAPDFIWTPEEWIPLLARYRDILLTEGASGRIEREDSRSHSYAASGPFALCFDPSAATPDVPRELNAGAAYLSAVRDGALALGLRPGHALAAPGFGLMETQPALLLACLLNGATYVHLTEGDLARKPSLIADWPLRVAGVTAAAREILLNSPVEIGKSWDFWFREPAESRDIEAWTDFAEALKLRDAFSCNQRWNASLGGCILFSARRKGSPHGHVLPAAGVPWSLADPADEARLSLWGHGWFSVRPPGAEEGGIVSGGLLAEAKNEWMFVRPVVSGHSGKFYPSAEVLEAVSGLPHGSSCSIVEVPASRADGSSRFVMLVFVGGRRVNEAHISEGIRKKILKELGKEFLPDAIQILALHPRRGEDGSIDHEWCGREYLSGGLSRRERGEIYRHLTELRDIVHDCR